MKTLPVLFCSKGCKRMLSFTYDEIKTKDNGYRYEIICHKCSCAIRLPEGMMEELRTTDHVKKELEEDAAEAAKEKSRKGPVRADTDEEKHEKGMKASKAYEDAGTYAGAAEILGVSTQTVKNWLDYLAPETVEPK